MSPEKTPLISSKEILERFNISYQTLNFYTNLGFFNVYRKAGNKRLFSAEEVENRIGVIRRLKQDGYPLRLIVRELLRESGKDDGGLDSTRINHELL